MPGEFEEEEYIVPRFKNIYIPKRDMMITSSTECIEAAVIGSTLDSSGR